MNKKARSKILLKPQAPFKWILMNIVPSTAPKILTSDTTFSNYLLIVDAYSKIPKLYGMAKITTEEVMDKLNMFQSRFGKIDQFGWWDFPEYGLKHIQFVHNFFCCDILPAIHFWYLRVGINN